MILTDKPKSGGFFFPTSNSCKMSLFSHNYGKYIAHTKALTMSPNFLQINFATKIVIYSWIGIGKARDW